MMRIILNSTCRSVGAFGYHQGVFRTCSGCSVVVGRALTTLSSSTGAFPEAMSEQTRRLAQGLDEDVTENPWIRRQALARAITLVESQAIHQQEQAGLLMMHLLQGEEEGIGRRETSRLQDGFRIGIAGPPGAGKSTFIEAMGRYILGLKNDPEKKDPKSTAGAAVDADAWIPDKLAVVCVDPSSRITGGSLLGDKTRMQELSRHERAFVRPAPASGTLGGMAPHTDDVVRLTLAAGFDCVLLETVGLGQSETEVEESVDMLVLLIPPAGGDDLQGVKKGIVEVSDLLVVTKADNNLLTAAKRTAVDYRAAMNLLRPKAGDVWQGPTPVLLSSSATGDGLDRVWEHISRFRKQRTETGQLVKRRQEQRRYWLWKHLQNLVLRETENDPRLQDLRAQLMEKLDKGSITPRVAAAQLLKNLRAADNL